MVKIGKGINGQCSSCMASTFERRSEGYDKVSKVFELSVAPNDSNAVCITLCRKCIRKLASECIKVLD